MAKGSNISSVLSGQVDAVLKPILTIVIVVVIIFLAKNLIEKWKLRNVGRTEGAKDGSNLATDVYLLDSVWVTPNKINEVCTQLLALTDAQLKQVYNKFDTLWFKVSRRWRVLRRHDNHEGFFIGTIVSCSRLRKKRCYCKPPFKPRSLRAKSSRNGFKSILEQLQILDNRRNFGSNYTA